MKNILLYMHGGSGNKGCEAIVRSTIGILNQKEKNNYTLASWSPGEDKKAGIDKLCNVILAKNSVSKKSVLHLFAVCWYKFFKSAKILFELDYKNFKKHSYKDMYAFSIGGDNYCYSGLDVIRLHHNKVKKEAKKSYLWGCSVEKSSLTPKTVKDLQNYDIIFARESITYEYLKEAGLNNIRLYPDPAFTLEKEEVALPEGFQIGNTVGINLSPYAFSGDKELAEKNYTNLIKWILDNTDMSIALIPHVNKGGNSDDECLKTFYNKFESDRIILVPDQKNCMQTKYIISKCRFFVGARTHSTIAAYSTKVPTMVLGYSIKSRGIAKDIFGERENYVLPVAEFKSENDVSDMFKKMVTEETEIGEYLDGFMDGYIKKAFSVIDELEQ